MKRFIPRRSLVALTLAIVLVLGSVPAYGTTAPAAVTAGVPVPSHALVGGVDLFSLDATAARAAIASESVVPTFGVITVKGDGHTKRFAAGNAIYLNVNAMLQQAYAATDTVTPFELRPVYAIKSSIVTGWTTKLSKAINHKATNAQRKVKGHILVVSAEKPGHRVKPITTGNRLRVALGSVIASPSATPKTVYAALDTIKPKVTRKNIPKAILVVLSKYTIKLYKGTKIEKKYKCAIGMRAFPTPKGKWKVTGKVKNPSWHNPGSSWAKGMPSVIPPGPSNPLGTRAIYLSAPGIRFHGTAKWWSIGHAASHGCMRMRRADVENFYPRVPVGITVWIVK